MSSKILQNIPSRNGRFAIILLLSILYLNNSEPIIPSGNGLETIICTNNSPVQYFNFPKLTRCNYNYKNLTKIKKYEIFKPNTIEFILNVYLCKK